MGDLDAELGKWLAASRRAKGVSQRTVGAVIDAQQQTVLKIEKGERPLRMSEGLMLAAFLEAPLPDLPVSIPPLCSTCRNRPAKGFTCNECGASG